MTVSIVPSTGRLTARYAVSLAPRNARPSSAGADALVLAEHLDEAADDLREDHAGVAASAHQRRARDVLGDGLAVDGRRGVERLDDRAEGEDEIRSRVAVGHRIDVEVVDAAAMRLEVLERAAREMTDELELHQCDRTPSMCTSSEAIGSPTIRSSSYRTRERTVSATSASFSPCSTTTRSSIDEPVRAEIDVDALLDAPREAGARAVRGPRARRRHSSPRQPIRRSA